MRPLSKRVLSLGAVALGLLVGILALASFGIWWPPFGDRDPGWLLRWISYIGMAVLGTIFIVASLIALRTAKRAGLVFLITMPCAVFCLAYPSAGYLVWHSDGSAWFESPGLPAAIGLTIVFFLPIYAGLLTIQVKEWALRLFASTAVLAGIVFGLSHWTKAFLPPFAEWSALFLLFGLFWRQTSKRNWPLLLKPRSRSRSQRATTFVLACISVLCADVAVTFALSALCSSLFSGDCSSKPIFIHPESPYHAVFTTRVIFVGRSMEALTQERGVFRDPYMAESHDPHAGDWAIGVVQERFWGLPPWSHLVLLTDYIYHKDATYFVDGSRGRGLLTRMLPIVEGRIGCSRTTLAQDAEADLRALHDASIPASNVIPH